MSKILTMIAMIAVVMFSGCSNETVPNGYIGKIIDRNGFHPEIYQPSRVNVGMHGHLILVQTTSSTRNEVVTVRMKDDMNLVAQVRFKIRMGEKEVSRNFVFNDIVPVDGKTITLNQIYALHGKALVNKAVREVLGTYNMADVNDNFNKISADIYNKTLDLFKPTPLIVTDVALGKLDFPQVIDDAIESAAKRELEIKQAEADVQVRLTELKGKEELAKGAYRVKMQEAKRIRDYNKMIGEGITPQLLELRRLEVQEAMVGTIEKGDATTIFIPYGSQNTVGMQTRMYSK